MYLTLETNTVHVEQLCQRSFKVTVEQSVDCISFKWRRRLAFICFFMFFCLYSVLILVLTDL